MSVLVPSRLGSQAALGERLRGRGFDVHVFDPGDEFLHQVIVRRLALPGLITRQMALHKIKNEPGDLRCNHAEIVGDNDKKDPNP